MALIDNLVSYYKLDENAANTTVVDTPGSDDGTSSTNTSNLYNASGKINSAFNLVRTSSEYVNIDALASSLDSTTTGSWQAWIKTPDATPAASSHIIMFGNSSQNTQLRVFLDTGGKILVVGLVNGVDKYTLITDNAVVSDNTWVHIVLSHNGTSPTLFINGVEVAQSFPLSVDETMWFNDATFDVGSIGRFHNGAATQQYFDGDIDEVGFWTRALSEAEALVLYNSGDGLAYPLSEGPDFTKLQLNIGDAWKAGAGVQINIGDAWKESAGAQINIGDAWKEVF